MGQRELLTGAIVLVAMLVAFVVSRVETGSSAGLATSSAASMSQAAAPSVRSESLQTSPVGVPSSSLTEPAPAPVYNPTCPSHRY